MDINRPAMQVKTNITYWKENIPLTRSVLLLVGWLVCKSVVWSVCHNFLKGRKVSLQYAPIGAHVIIVMIFSIIIIIISLPYEALYF